MPHAQPPHKACLLPADGEFLLAAVFPLILPGVDDQAVDPVRAELLEHQVDVVRLVILRPAHVLAGSGAEIQEEVPRDDRRLIAPAHCLHRLAQREPLRLVRRVEPVDPAVQAGPHKLHMALG